MEAVFTARDWHSRREFFTLARFDIGWPDSCISVTSRRMRCYVCGDRIAFPWDVPTEPLAHGWGWGRRRGGHEQRFHALACSAWRPHNGEVMGLRTDAVSGKHFQEQRVRCFDFGVIRCLGIQQGVTTPHTSKRGPRQQKAEKKGPWWYGWGISRMGWIFLYLFLFGLSLSLCE